MKPFTHYQPLKNITLLVNSIMILPSAGLLIFREKKSKISRDFQWQIRGKIGRFRGIVVGKKSKFVEKSAHFRGKLRQDTISKKQPISRDIFWQISLTLINFVSIWKASFNVFLAGIIICSFNNSSLEKWTNLKAVNIMVSGQFFATFI